VLDVTLIALTIALFLALNALDTFVLAAIPPLFLSLSLHYLALFFLCYVTESFWKTFLAGTISGLLLLVFPTTYFLSFPQFIFDYWLPTMVFSLSFFIHFQIDQKKSQIMRWMVFIIIPFIFVFISRVIAGIMFYQAAAWNGVSPLFYSVAVNTVNTGFDLFISLIIIPLVLSRLWVLKNKYQQRNIR
jgi:thiamine transporter